MSVGGGLRMRERAVGGGESAGQIKKNELRKEGVFYACVCVPLWLGSLRACQVLLTAIQSRRARERERTTEKRVGGESQTIKGLTKKHKREDLFRGSFGGIRSRVASTIGPISELFLRVRETGVYKEQGRKERDEREERERGRVRNAKKGDNELEANKNTTRIDLCFLCLLALAMKMVGGVERR